MFRITVSVFLIMATVFWLVLRRLREFPIVLRTVFLLLLFTLLLRPMACEAYLTYSEIIFNCMICFLALLMFSYKLSNDQHAICFAKPDKYIIGFMAMLFISTLSSIQKGISLNYIFYFCGAYLLYWIIINLPQKDKTIRVLLNVLLASAFLVIIYGIYQYFYGFSQMRDFLRENPQLTINSREFFKRASSNAVFSTFLYPPAFAGYLMMVFLTALGIFTACKPLSYSKKIIPQAAKKFFLLLFLLSSAFSIIITKSKGGVLCLLAGILFFIYLNRKNKKHFRKIPLFIIAAILIFSGLAMAIKINLPKPANFIASLEVRLEYWTAAINMIKAKPFFGFGPGTFGNIYPLFKTKTAEETIMAHNSYLQICAESGIFAFIFFALFWIKLIGLGFASLNKMASEKKIIPAGILAAIISSLLHNFVDFDFFVPQNIHAIFAATGIFMLSCQDKTGVCLKKVHFPQKHKFAFIFCAAAFFLFFIFFNARQIVAEEYNKKAVEAVNRNKYNEALSFFEKAATVNNLSPKYKLYAALIFERMFLNIPAGKDDFSRQIYLNESINYYSQAIKLDQYWPYLHYKFGEFLFSTGKEKFHPQAIKEIELAASLYPVNPFYHEQLVKFYGIIGNPKLSAEEQAKADELKKYYFKGTR